MLDIGTTAPSWTLLDQDGTEHTLADYRGHWLVIYFYPKDATPGCTTEACMIRDSYDGFEDIGAMVFGVSRDSVRSHRKFGEKYDLPFVLLADTSGVMVEAYEAQGTLGGIKRVSYIINPEGLVAKSYEKVSPATHATELIADLNELTK